MDEPTYRRVLEILATPDKDQGRTYADAGFEQRIAVLKARSEWDEWLASLGKKKNGRTKQEQLWRGTEETLDCLGDQLRGGGETRSDSASGESFDEQAGRVDSGICHQRLQAFRKEWFAIRDELSGRIARGEVPRGNDTAEPPPF